MKQLQSPVRPWFVLAHSGRAGPLDAPHCCFLSGDYWKVCPEIVHSHQFVILSVSAPASSRYTQHQQPLNARVVLRLNEGLERWFGDQEHFLYLQRTLLRFLAPTRQLRTISHCSSRCPNAFGSLQAPGTDVVPVHTCRQKTYTHRKQIKSKNDDVK